MLSMHMYVYVYVYVVSSELTVCLDFFPDEPDYEVIHKTQPLDIAFAEGQTTTMITINLVDDDILEGQEEFNVFLMAAPNRMVNILLCKHIQNYNIKSERSQND